MKVLPLFLAALLGLALCPINLDAQTFYTLLTNGPTAKRINIVFLAEGYTAGQTNQFTNNAITSLNALLNTTPFSDYRSYYNAFAIFVPSAEAGSDHPSRSVYKNTYFNSTYDSSGIARLITIDSTGRNRVYSLLQTYMPEYDRAFLIVNDTEYGGSGGSIIITSVNSSSAQIGVHETGHSYAGLGDEYEEPYPGYPDTEEPNTTRQTIRASIKWNAWIAGTTPIPTPETSTYGSVIGLFEGAHYHATGWYRPKLNCVMRSLSVPFCEVCAEALVKSTYGYIRPIEAVVPATNSVLIITNNDSLVLSATTMAPSLYPLAIQWEINNAPVSGATNATLTLPPGFLLPGTNTARIVVTDPTTKVRTDPTQILRDSRTWKLDVREGPPVQPSFHDVTRLANGFCLLRVSGAVTQAWQLQWSTNLPQWYDLVWLTNKTGTVSYLDTRATNAVQRFYRVLYSP